MSKRQVPAQTRMRTSLSLVSPGVAWYIQAPTIRCDFHLLVHAQLRRLKFATPCGSQRHCAPSRGSHQLYSGGITMSGHPPSRVRASTYAMDSGSEVSYCIDYPTSMPEQMGSDHDAGDPWGVKAFGGVNLGRGYVTRLKRRLRFLRRLTSQSAACYSDTSVS